MRWQGNKKLNRMSKKKYSPLNNLPQREVFEKLVGNLEYKRIETTELPSEIQNNELIKKWNSCILAASGSTETMCYTIVGLRPDENNTVIDEHPIVVGYDNLNPSHNFGGIINHGKWKGRTLELEQYQIDLLNTCGLHSGFTYKGIPPKTSGSLYELNENGMLEGVTKQFNILLKNNT